MTKDEKKELGLMLDKYGVKSLFYGERIGQHGVYLILYYDDSNDEIKETKIYGKDLE